MTSILVTFSASVGASPDIGSLLRAYLMQHYPWTDVEVNNPVTIGALPGREPERILVEKGPPGKTVFLLEFDGGKSATVSADVKAFDSVVMARRAIAGGRCVQEDDIYTATMETSRVPQGAVRDPGKILGKSLRRSSLANAPILENMVSETPLVRRGQKVLLIAAARGFSIAATGEMKQDAFVGKHVRVMNLSSKKTVTGILEDENTVRVEY